MQPRTGELTPCEEAGGSKNKKVKTCREYALVPYQTENLEGTQLACLWSKPPTHVGCKSVLLVLSTHARFCKSWFGVTAVGLNVVVTEPSTLCALRLSWPWKDRPSLISRLSFSWGQFSKQRSQLITHIPTRSLVSIYYLFQGPLTLISPGSVTRWPGRNIQLTVLTSVNLAKPKPTFLPTSSFPRKPHGILTPPCFLAPAITWATHASQQVLCGVDGPHIGNYEQHALSSVEVISCAATPTMLHTLSKALVC